MKRVFLFKEKEAQSHIVVSKAPLCCCTDGNDVVEFYIMHLASHYSKGTSTFVYLPWLYFGTDPLLSKQSRDSVIICVRSNGIYYISQNNLSPLKWSSNQESPSLGFVTQYGALHTIFTQCSKIVPSKGLPWRSVTLTWPKAITLQGGGAWCRVQEGDDWWTVVAESYLSTIKLWEGCHCMSKCLAFSWSGFIASKK